MKFSGPVQHHTSNFWVGCKNSQSQGYSLCQKQPVSGKSIASQSFCPTGMSHTFLETSGQGLKSLRSGILNFEVGHEILVSEWAGTCQNIIFLEFGIFT